jgi:hypothetical protein
MVPAKFSDKKSFLSKSQQVLIQGHGFDYKGKEKEGYEEDLLVISTYLLMLKKTSFSNAEEAISIVTWKSHSRRPPWERKLRCLVWNLLRN